MVRDTSLLSYLSLAPELGERQLLVYRALQRVGPATDMEVAVYLGVRDPNMVRPRRKELYDRHLVRAVGKRECKITGRMAYIWSAVQYGAN